MMRAEAAIAASAFVKLRGLMHRRYRHSVFRRTALLLCLLLPAYGANLAVVYVAADLLSAAQFGLFYVAITLSNILFSGAFVINLFFTRDFVATAQANGETAIFGRMRQVERLVIVWGVPASAITLAAMFAASGRLGVQSYAISVFIVLDAYTGYVAELGRVLLQSLHRTLLLGSYTLAWMVLRFVLCVVGILAFGTVWGALCGTATSAVMVYVGFRIAAARKAPAASGPAVPMPRITTLVPAVFGYGLSIIVSNLDILLAYALLSQTALGTYSASSIFPKAMLVVLTPLLQMLFPMLIGNEQTRGELLTFLGKIGVAVVLLAGLGALVVWQLSPWVCGNKWGMPLCEPRLLHILLLSVVPLVLMRLLVLLGFARGRDWLTAWLVLPTVAYLWIALSSVHGENLLAKQFTVFSAIAFSLLFVVNLVAARPRRPSRV